MVWRVIVRIGITSDDGSVVRNSLILPELSAAGLENTKTGTWECSHANPVDAANHLSQILMKLASPNSISGASKSMYLKHMWIYIDNVGDQDGGEKDEE